MLDNISYWILDTQLELPITNLIYSSGGKFYIFAPNNKMIQEKIEYIQRQLEMKFFNEYDDDLGVIIGSISLNSDDLKYDDTKKMHLISEKWDELNKIVERNKRHKFSKNWNYDLLLPAGIDGDLERCSATGKELANKNKVESTQSALVSLVEGSPIMFKKYKVDNKVFYKILDNEGKDTNDFISEEQFMSQKFGTLLKRKNNTISVNNYLAGFSVLDINSFEILNSNVYENNIDSTIVRHILLNDSEITKLNGKQPIFNNPKTKLVKTLINEYEYILYL